MFDTTLKRRLAVAEAALAEANARLEGIETLMADRCVLVSISKATSRTVRFVFVRNGTLHAVEAYADMSLDVTALRRTLLERQEQ